MVDNEQIADYRKRTSTLLSAFRQCLYYEFDRKRFPTDASISSILGISPQAFSSISRQCASMSGFTLLKLLQELSKRVNDESFLIIMRQILSS